MKKQYMKPELETVEVMVELGFATSTSSVQGNQMEAAYPVGLENDAYLLEGSTVHPTQGDQWGHSQTSWF